MIGCLFTMQYKLCFQDNNWKQFVDSFKNHEKKTFQNSLKQVQQIRLLYLLVDMFWKRIQF